MENFTGRITEAAARVGLPAAVVRYWVITQGGLLGARADRGDLWSFSPHALAFFKRLATQRAQANNAATFQQSPAPDRMVRSWQPRRIPSQPGRGKAR